MLKKAIAVLPSDADLYFDIANLYEIRNDRKNARANYAKSVHWFIDDEDSTDLIIAREKIKKLN